MWKRLLQLVSGKDLELRERMLRTIILVGGLAAIVANGEMMIVTKMNNDIVYMMLLLLCSILIYKAMQRYGKMSYSIKRLGKREHSFAQM